MKLIVPLWGKPLHGTIKHISYWMLFWQTSIQLTHPKWQHLKDQYLCQYLPPTWEICWNSRYLALAYPSRGCCGHLGSEPIKGRSFCDFAILAHENKH